jgi:hypothetical protein
MGGRDERRGRDPDDRDPDDWFAEPEPPVARRARAEERRAEPEVAPAEPDAGDDWLGTGDRKPPRAPRHSPLAEPRLLIAGVGALAVLIVVVLALSGVFSSSSPRRAATTRPSTTRPSTTGPGTTRAGTTTRATTTGTAPAATPAPSVPLKPGDQGPQVTLLQRALAKLGYSPGAIDGNYGLSTQRAVSQFQSASKLTPDGVLGPQTLAALRTALKGH